MYLLINVESRIIVMIVFDLVFWEVIDLNFLFIFGCV